MKKSFFIIVAAFWGLFSVSAFAGPQFVDATGYAVSGYDVVAYHGLKQSEVGKAQASAVPGKKSIMVEYNGAKWAFANEENKAKFLENPAKYVPAFDGHCAYGVAKGGKVPGNPHLWRIVDGKLYLNITKTVVGFWEADIPGNIKTGNSNWTGLVSKPASTRNIPDFDSKKAPAL